MATPIPKNRASFSAWTIAAATGGTLTRVRDGAPPAVGITSDSRAVEPNGVFVALRGERFDGHDFVAAAIEAGASVVVVERGRGPSTARADVIEVDDTLAAWGAIARAHLRAWRRTGPKRVVAITGSAGKTTTKELCAALLRADGCHATAGNLNNLVGLPSVIFGVEPSHRYAVLEMGMSRRGEISALAAIAEPDVALITNVGLGHAGGVGGTRADVAREKGALYEALRRDGVAVVNADDAAAQGELARTVALHAPSFGGAPHADYRLVQRTPLGADGAQVTVSRPGAPPLSLAIPLLGHAAALDFAAALAAAEAALGGPLAPERVADALKGFTLGPGRMYVRRRGDGAIVLDDSYNANPASMRAAFEVLAEVAADGRRAVAVLGEMKELGPHAAAEHQALGEALARAGVRVAIGCGGLVDRALDAAEGLGVKALRAASTEEAARVAATQVSRGDVVLVKGSRGVGTERVVDAIMGAPSGPEVPPDRSNGTRD